MVLEAFVRGQLCLPHRGASGSQSSLSTREEVLTIERGFISISSLFFAAPHGLQDLSSLSRD